MSGKKDENFDQGFNEPAERDPGTFEVRSTLDEVVDSVLKKRPKEGKKNYDLPKKWGLVRLEQKRSEHEIDDVPVCCNGHNVILQRGMWVPINWAFIEILKNAKYPQYANKPGEQRKVVGMVSRFPYQGPFELSEQEFNHLRKVALKGEIPIKDYPERYQAMMDAA
jgi:hypothetical protein